MKTDFARAVDPLFLYVIDLIERIERNESPEVQEVRVRARGLLDQAEQTLGRRDDWVLAKYALASWIDELLIDAPWKGSSWWVNNSLEYELFNTAEAHSTFYVKVEEAKKRSYLDALEVFYVCVVLGFRGMYRSRNVGASATDYHRDPRESGFGLNQPPQDSGVLPAAGQSLPDDLEVWAKQTAMAIKLGQGRPPVTERPQPGHGAPPLDGKFSLVGMSLVCVCLTAITFILGLLYWQSLA